MDRELDAVDLRLLTTLAVQGEINPRDLDDQRRLNRLELEGYVALIRKAPPGLTAAPAWTYRLTSKGESVVNL